MQKLTLGLTLVAAAVFSHSAIAQCTLAAAGTGLNLGSADDGLYSGTLSFAFPWPGGSSDSTIDVDTNGRIFPGGSGDGSDFTDSLGEFANDAHPTIALYWSDTDSGNFPTSNVELIDLGSSAIIRYNDWSYLNSAASQFQGQIELFPDGSFFLTYAGDWSPLGTNPGIVGTSQGNGVILPTESDISAAPASAGNPNLFEQFTGGGADDLDLVNSTVQFFPDGAGGYVAVQTACNFVPAVSAEFGPSCNFGTPPGPPVALSWIPSGTGYIVIDVSTTAAFDPINLGTSLAMGDDTISTVNLGAAFTMPDGSSYSQLDVDSNGKLNVVGTDASDFTPTAAEFLASPALAPFHSDLSPNISGDVLFFTNGAQANVTWLDVPEFGETNSVTVQIQLDLTGSDIFTVIYQNIWEFDTVGDTLLIGTSAGTGAGTAIDLSTAGAGLSYGNSGYEFFDAATSQDLQAPGVINAIDYAALNRPVTGTVYQTAASNIPATALQGFILLGLQRWPTPDGTIQLAPFLDPAIDSSCVLTHQIGYGSFPLSAAQWTPGSPTATYDLDLTTAGASGVDLPINLQMIFIDPGAPWGGGTFPLITSNGIEAVGGNL